MPIEIVLRLVSLSLGFCLLDGPLEATSMARSDVGGQGEASDDDGLGVQHVFLEGGRPSPFTWSVLPWPISVLPATHGRV